MFSADDRERAFKSTVARLRNDIPEPKLGLYYRGVQGRWKEGENKEATGVQLGGRHFGYIHRDRGGLCMLLT